ncbi:hypothetical protein OFC49_42575, partial [Escherichia coli]|nr:hypothetical protein [Escherichia coli]
MLPVSVESFDYDAIDMICQHLDRGTNLSVMITGTSIFVDVNDQHVEVDRKSTHLTSSQMCALPIYF